jgi:hypothetical protein
MKLFVKHYQAKIGNAVHIIDAQNFKEAEIKAIELQKLANFKGMMVLKLSGFTRLWDGRKFDVKAK